MLYVVDDVSCSVPYFQVPKKFHCVYLNLVLCLILFITSNMDVRKNLEAFVTGDWSLLCKLSRISLFWFRFDGSILTGKPCGIMASLWNFDKKPIRFVSSFVAILSYRLLTFSAILSLGVKSLVGT